LGAQAVVGGDLLGRHTGERQQERDDEAGPILAAHAVDEDTAGRGLGDRGDRAREVGPEALQNLEVCTGRRRPRVDRRPRLLVVLVDERDVNDVDRNLAGRIGRELSREPEVDDRPDPVRDESVPSLVAELADAVRPDDGAERGATRVPHRMPAEIADVDAPVPVEPALRHPLIFTTGSRRPA
jgi:hypothetical protein